MHHDVLPGAAIGAVIGVGEADIEGEMVLAARVHLILRDEIEPFRRLTVALADLGPEAARIGADRIGFEEMEAAVVLGLPYFELRLGLEDADEDGRFLGHALLSEQRARLGRKRLHVGRRELAAAAQHGDQSHHARRENGRCQT